jgi:putative hydrolase
MPALAQRNSTKPSTSLGLNITTSSNDVSTDLLLAIDQDYRKKAANDSLPKIAPKQLNRLGIAWLPVMDKTIQGWRFQVQFSNTLRANQLGKINDWVIIRYTPTGKLQNKKAGKVTIVTETHGAREGQRVVRGREAECFTTQSELAI